MSSKNSSKQKNNGLQSTFTWVVYLILGIICSVIGFRYFSNEAPENAISLSEDQVKNNSLSNKLDNFLPSSHGQIIAHKYYTLSYVEKYEQAEWTAYTMNRQMLNAPNVPRYNNFTPDYSVKTRSAFHRDYSNSGYTRGHLVPAGDMAFDTSAMRESFFMSNMSPQVKAFNNGIWKELEENIRDWTYKAGSLYIITGPIFSNNPKTIGQNNKVSVPTAFYKVLLDFNQDNSKGIAFIIPHDRSDVRLEEYMVSIDSVESVTGIDFFHTLTDDKTEENFESIIQKNLWNVSDKRYHLRVDRWNNE